MKQDTTFISLSSKKFKYSDIKFKVRNYIITRLDAWDKKIPNNVKIIVLDFAWQTILFFIAFQSLGFNRPLGLAIGVAILLPVFISYFKEIVYIVRK